MRDALGQALASHGVGDDAGGAVGEAEGTVDPGDERRVKGADASGFSLEVRAWGGHAGQEVDGDLSVVSLVSGVE